MEPDEMLVDIQLPAMNQNQRGTFVKLGLRRAQAISLVNVAVVVTFDETDGKTIDNSSIAFGSVAPTIVSASEAESFLVGKQLSEDVIHTAVELAMRAIRPISDVRGSDWYRYEMAKVITRRGLTEIAQGSERDEFPEDPVLLMGKHQDQKTSLSASYRIGQNTPIETRINGKKVVYNTGQNKTLLRLLREEGGLTGAKEGCAEGECGACTIFLDGAAVMSCMVPAPRAHGAEITTIEGLSSDGVLHPVQESFIGEGAVQCGYCTPGFIMSAVKLLEEKPRPDTYDIKHAIAGNLCRCTGYYKLIKAIEQVAGSEVKNGKA